MAYSYDERTAADSSDKTYAFTFDYIDTDDIKCSVDGTELTQGDSVNGFTLSGSNAILGSSVGVIAGSVVRVFRETATTPLIDFQPNQTVLESHLDTATLQTLYRALEAFDRAYDVLPTAGDAGAVLRKTSATDFDVQWDDMLDPTLPSGDMDGGALTWDSAGLPVGVKPTAEGQVLTATDGNTDQANYETCPRFLNGSGAPGASVGYAEDWYMDTDTGRLWLKASGTWTNLALIALLP